MWKIIAFILFLLPLWSEVFLFSIHIFTQMCVHMCAYIYTSLVTSQVTYMEDRKQFSGISYFLPRCGFLRSSFGSCVGGMCCQPMSHFTGSVPLVFKFRFSFAVAFVSPEFHNKYLKLGWHRTIVSFAVAFLKAKGSHPIQNLQEPICPGDFQLELPPGISGCGRRPSNPAIFTSFCSSFPICVS